MVIKAWNGITLSYSTFQFFSQRSHLFYLLPEKKAWHDKMMTYRHWDFLFDWFDMNMTYYVGMSVLHLGVNLLIIHQLFFQWLVLLRYYSLVQLSVEMPENQPLPCKGTCFMSFELHKEILCNYISERQNYFITFDYLSISNQFSFTFFNFCYFTT